MFIIFATLFHLFSFQFPTNVFAISSTHLVLIHGSNDNCFTGSLTYNFAEQIVNLTTTKTHKTTFTCLKLAKNVKTESISSIMTSIESQMKIICSEMKKQVVLDEGIDKIILIGLSQGGLQARAVLAVCPNALPNERKFNSLISIGN